MKFQIEKLIIWPKNKAYAPREIAFEVGKVNVITGASRTGKSAIIPIIDYCLASSDCFIPIDTIRDYASWYGIVIQASDEKLLIARGVPDGSTPSNNFFVIRGEQLFVPCRIEEPNQRANDVKLLLNQKASTPFFDMGDEDDQAFKARLSFRDLMALVFQSQEIVANQNILFYKTHAHKHRERLRNWFPYILGAESLEVLKARHHLKDIEAQLGKLRREFEKIEKVSSGWLANMRGLLNVAGEYGLLHEAVSDRTTPEELLYIAKGVLDNPPDQPNTTVDDVERASSEIGKLEKQDDDLSTSIGIVKKRLNDLRLLRGNFVDYGKGVRKRVDRLQISKWLRDVAKETSGCPVCGSLEHPDSAVEIEKICSAFERHEDASKRTADVPTSFDREEVMLEKELRELLAYQKDIRTRFDLELSKDKEARQEFQKRKEMYLFLGHLKAALEVLGSLSDGGIFKCKIKELEDEQERLQKIASRAQVKRMLDLATVKIAHNALEHLKILDVEEKYRNIAPRFSVNDLSVEVLSDDGHWHFLAEVGSASNWVSFHLALMCGLQEFFLEQEPSIVPSFVIFDQPSQVYFPKLRKNSDQTDDPKYETDEDVNAVKRMFETLSSSVRKNGGRWQAIVLDHADKSVYGEIDGVVEVEEWRDGKKLIPEEWYIPLADDDELEEPAGDDE
ncbi:MAG: DUF3732 domain-containing protein [Pontiellaceae bacterium]|nr:DUF3732 domain-containing protein [Pontiellaceae bacterium]